MLRILSLPRVSFPNIKELSWSSFHSARCAGFTLYGYFICIRMRTSRRKSKQAESSLDWKAVGRRIRELRGFDLTQEKFAQRIGVSQNYLSTMEHGKVQIGAEILLRVSREFGKSLEWLLTGEDWARR